MLWACITFLTSCGALPCRASLSWILMEPSSISPCGYGLVCSLLGWPWCQTTQNSSDSVARLGWFQAEGQDTFSRDKNYCSSSNLTLHHRASGTWWNQNQLSWRLKHFTKQNQPVTNNGNSETYFSGLPTIYVDSSILPAFDAIMMLTTTI